MRVLLLTNGLRYGGAERVVEALADGLRERGDSVRVVATTRGGPIADALQQRGHPVEVLGLAHPLDIRAPFRLGRIAARHRIDVIHSHLAVADITAAWALDRAMRVSTVHNSGVELGWFKRWAWRGALGRIDRVTAVSQAVARKLPVRDTSVIHPSLIDLRTPRRERRDARKALGVDPDRPLVLGVGRLVPIKGFDVLAQAISHLPAQITVAIIGEGPQRAELEKMPGLTLLGPRSDAATLINAADVLAVPSRSEGFPQVVLEAMVAEVPIVATEVGGTPEIVEAGKSGLLVPPEDPAALAQAIGKLLDDPAEANRYAKAGKIRLVTEGWIRSEMVRKFREVYRSPTRARINLGTRNR